MAIGVLLIEVLMLFILQTLGISARSNAFICMLIMIFSIAYFIDICNNEKLFQTRSALIQGYLLRLLLLFWDTYGRGIYVLPNLAADGPVLTDSVMSWSCRRHIAEIITSQSGNCELIET